MMEGWEAKHATLRVALVALAAVLTTTAAGQTVVGEDQLAVGDLVIVEIMNNPSVVSDLDGEWFEVFNPTVNDIEMEGIEVRDDDFDSFVVTGSLVVPAGGVVVLGASADMAANGGAPVDHVYDRAIFALGNGADEVVLVTSAGLEIDRVTYDGGPTFPDPAGASMTLDPDRTNAADNDDGNNWCQASTPFGDGDLGTPGAPNDDCAGVGPPPPVPELPTMVLTMAALGLVGAATITRRR